MEMKASSPAPVSATLSAAADQSSAVVELRNVTLGFGDKCVLDDVSLMVRRQERLVIIGQSAAGKTTMLRLILGILSPTTGSVFLDQLEIPRLAPRELQQARMRMGMVYQDSALLSSSTVRENLALP